MFCKAPFTSQSQWHGGSSQMCCNDKNMSRIPMAEEWNSEDRKQARLDFIEGKIPDRCNHCVYIKDFGSLPKWYDRVIPETKEELIAMCDPDGHINAKPKYLHMSPSNKCQLACRMCTPCNSTMFGKVFGKEFEGGFPPEDIVEYIRSCADNLVYFVYHGGEPTLSPEFQDIIDILTPYGDQMELCMLSNGMNKNIDWDELRKFRDVSFIFSVDGTKKYNDYQRVFSDLDRVVRNIKLAQEELPHMKLLFNHAVSNLNVTDVPEFYQMMVETFPDAISLHHGVVVEPPYYDLCNLPEYQREVVLEKIEALDTSEFPEVYKEAYDKVSRLVKTVFKDKPFNEDTWRTFITEEFRKKHKIKGSMGINEIIPIKSI